MNHALSGRRDIKSQRPPASAEPRASEPPAQSAPAYRKEILLFGLCPPYHEAAHREAAASAPAPRAQVSAQRDYCPSGGVGTHRLRRPRALAMSNSGLVIAPYHRARCPGHGPVTKDVGRRERTVGRIEIKLTSGSMIATISLSVKVVRV